MKKQIFISISVFLFVFGCSKAASAGPSAEDIAFWKSMPEKMCAKMTKCMDEWIPANAPAQAREMMKSMYSKDKCIMQQKAVVHGSQGAASAETVDPQKIKYSKQCMESFMSASCADLKDNGSAELPGCKELNAMNNQN